jgi:hypothetical protein
MLEQFHVDLIGGPDCRLMTVNRGSLLREATPAMASGEFRLTIFCKKERLLQPNVTPLPVSV